MTGTAPRLAIVTGKGARSAEISLGFLGLQQYFDGTETGSADRPAKPDGIHAVLRRWSVPPHEVAYVGDAPSDVEVAKQVGLVPLAAAWAATSDADRLHEHGPLAVFPTVASFAAWVDKYVT